MEIVQLVNEAVQVTGRPDQRSWALASLNMLLKDICRSADFPSDLYETEFNANEFGEQVSGAVSVTIPALDTFLIPPPIGSTIRKIAYLVYDNQQVTEVTPHNLLLEGCAEQDIFYRNGLSQLIINSSKAFTTLKIGVYVLPGTYTIGEGTPHWLLTEADDLLLTGMLAKIYKNTGDDASHDRFFQEYNIMKRAFKLDRVNSGVI